jgi:hypothetical protein
MTPDPLKEITTELFTVIRDVYNNGSIDIKYNILVLYHLCIDLLMGWVCSNILILKKMK